MSYNEYPPDVHAAAYTLHIKGLSIEQIEHELDKYCQKTHKRTGPSARAIMAWKKKDEWKAQDELAKAQLLKDARETSIEEQLKILNRLKKLEDEALGDFYSQANQKVRMSRGQALYGALEITRLRNQLLKEASKGLDIRAILEAAMETFVKYCRQVVGVPFIDKETEIFALVEKELLENNAPK